LPNLGTYEVNAPSGYAKCKAGVIEEDLIEGEVRRPHGQITTRRDFAIKFRETKGGKEREQTKGWFRVTRGGTWVVITAPGDRHETRAIPAKPTGES